MFRPLCRSSFYFCSAIIAPHSVKAAIDGTEETGWDRVVKIFQLDDYDRISPELSNIYNTTLMTGFTGALYGGFIHSRDAYMKFIESNEATKFTDHFEAKKCLQDHVTKAFGLGALRWSWRLALFGGMYVTGVSLMSAYRGSHSIMDYALAGCISGSIYRVNYGLNGVIVGGTLGLFIGLLAGSMTLMLMRFSGTDYDDITSWHKDKAYARERHLSEALEKTVMKDGLKMLAEHDERIS